MCIFCTITSSWKSKIIVHSKWFEKLAAQDIDLYYASAGRNCDENIWNSHLC